MPPHSHSPTHAHGHPPAPGGPVHAGQVPGGADQAIDSALPALLASRVPVPAVSLLMQSVVLRLLGATGIAALLWLAVAWALKGQV